MLKVILLKNCLWLILQTKNIARILRTIIKLESRRHAMWYLLLDDVLKENCDVRSSCVIERVILVPMLLIYQFITYEQKIL